jgi:hypothetical protein
VNSVFFTVAQGFVVKIFSVVNIKEIVKAIGREGT